MPPAKPYLLKLLLFLAVFNLCQNSFGQVTEIRGRVIDSKDKSPISFANVRLKGTLTGSSTDADGYFSFRTIERSDSIIVTYIGYPNKAIAIKRGVYQEMTIEMGSNAVQLIDVPVGPKTGRHRHHIDTAAMYVFHQVVEHKKFNKEEAFDDYKLEEYQKLEIGIENPRAWFLKLRILRPFAFALANRDTTADSTVIIPMLLKEDITDVYYRRKPLSNKRIMKATQFTGIDNTSIGSLINYTFYEINAYDEIFNLLGKSFVSPFAHGASGTYDYFLTDTVRAAGRTAYKIHFVGKSHVDLDLKGYAWIDSASWAIKAIDFRPNEKSNFNYIKDYSISQKYQLVNNKTWMLESEDMTTVGTILKKAKNQMAIVVKKHMARRKIQLDVPIEDTIFRGLEKEMILPDARVKTREYWDTMRFDPLKGSEVRLVQIHDTIKKVPAYKRIYWTIKLFSTADFQVKFLDIGRLYKLVSRNEVEGTRLRLGVGTNEFFSRKYHIFGYGAYGVKDHVFRYNITAHFPLPSVNELWRQFEFYYQYDLNVLGANNQILTFDNTISFLKALRPQDFMNIREWKLSLENEWITGFSSTISAHDQTFYDLPGVLDFKVRQDDGNIVHLPNFNTFELAIDSRYSYHDKYYRYGFYRYFIATKSPVFLFNYHIGLLDLDGKRSVYNNFQLTMVHRLSWALGHTWYQLQLGKILGKSPYPLSYVTPGGQGLIFNDQDYNATSQFEFVTDQYFSWWLEHHFDGYFFNKIPLFNRLQIREVIYMRGLWGSYSQSNLNTLIPGFNFKAPSAYPYMEAGFSFENVLKVLRFDFIWRLTYRNNALAHNFQPKFGLNIIF